MFPDGEVSGHDRARAWGSPRHGRPGRPPAGGRGRETKIAITGKQ